MWLARNKNGELLVFSVKPTFCKERGRFESPDDEYSLFLSKDEFPEVTFENSPIKVTSLKHVSALNTELLNPLTPEECLPGDKSINPYEDENTI